MNKINTLLVKLLSSFGLVALIFGLGVASGYHIKSNQVNSANAKQDIKLATLQSKYDNISALAQENYLIAFNEVIHRYESNPTINTNDNHHDQLWNFFNRHRIAGEVSKNKPSDCLDAKAKTSIINGRENTIQLEFLQSYIRQIQELQ